MILNCSVLGKDIYFKLKAPFLLKEGMYIEFNEKTYALIRIIKVCFDTDGNLESAEITLKEF